jgi:hypothetical protein
MPAKNAVFSQKMQSFPEKKTTFLVGISFFIFGRSYFIGALENSKLPLLNFQ